MTSLLSSASSAILVAALFAPAAFASETLTAATAPIELNLARIYAGQASDEASSGTASAPRWGEKGCVTANIFGGYADDFEETSVAPVALGISWFPIKNFSIDVQAEGAFVSQPGEDAAGAGLAMMLRWHFLDFTTWTLYADLGVGFLVLNEPVPATAEEFAFTPRAGIGASIELTTSTRLMTGIRWMHISNAETAFENPAVDAVQGYVGVSFAF